MKNKIFGLLSLSMIFVLVLTSLASAAITFSNVPTLLTDGTSGKINVTTNETETISFTASQITDINGKKITFSAPSTGFNGDTKEITISYTIESGFNFILEKTYSTTLTASGSKNPSATQTISFKVKTPDQYDNLGSHLDVSIDDISVEDGFGEDTDWYPLDNITAKIDVQNDGNEKIKNLLVEWGLYDTETGKWIIKDKESKFSLDDGDEKIVNIKFQLDKLNKIDSSNTDNYKFYAWATGEDEDYDGNKTSEYGSEEISLNIDSDFVILDNIQTTESVSCGSELQITGDVWNIGEEEQNDVYVTIYNKELGINKKVTIGDIDSFDSAEMNALITIPEDAEAKSYQLVLEVYNEDNEIYQNDNDDESKSNYVINVNEGCSTAPKVSVAATLESDAKSGQELVFKTTVVNTGSKKSTLGISVADTDWASTATVDKPTITLDAGKSEEVIIKMNVNKDVSGEKQFNIIIKDGDKTASQPVTVSIEKSSVFSGMTGFVTKVGGNNWYLWGIGGLDVIIVLVIIFVIVKMRKKE